MKKFLLGISLVLIIVATIIPLTAMTNKDIIAENCYLVENSTGKVLFAKGENEKREIASMVKIMTLLLTFESIDNGKINLDDMVTISNNSATQTGSELFIDEGKQYSVSDLVKGTVVVSANDASVALAEHIAGSEKEFVRKMNERAKQLSMENTIFINPTGLSGQNNEEQCSTAKDVNIMTRELLKHKDYYKYSSIWVEDYTHPSGRVTGLANTNKLVRFYKGCDSGKTGFTNTAKYCLSASAMRNDMRIVGTVLGVNDSKQRFNTMRNLFDYAFANYSIDVVKKSGEFADCEVKISKGTINATCPIFSKDLTYLKSRENKDYEVAYEVNDLIAPIKKGDVIGLAKIMVNGEVQSQVEMLSSENIEKATLWDYLRKLTSASF